MRVPGGNRPRRRAPADGTGRPAAVRGSAGDSGQGAQRGPVERALERPDLGPRAASQRVGAPQPAPVDHGPDVRLPGSQIDVPETRGLLAAQRHMGNMPVLKLIPVHDRHRPVVPRVMRPVVTIVVHIVGQNTRIIVPAERAPSVVIAPMVPMNPGRAPGNLGNPVPAQPESPSPTAIMVDRPAPRLIRDPGPAARSIPAPAAVIIRPPIRVIESRGPNIAIRLLIDPAPVIGQLLLIIAQLGRQVAVRNILAVLGVPVLVEIIEIVPAV